MKKLFIVVVLMSFITFSDLNLTHAQEDTTNTTQPDINEGSAPPIGEEQDPNPPANEESSDNNTTTNESQNQTFTNGVLAGGVIGLIVGAVLAWLFKDKFYK